VAAVAVRLQARGYENLVILQGGFQAWRQAGGPVTDGEAGP
jgi:rhodanese-related sulfurtransferase